MNIVIIGGGIAGLSAATILCELPNINVIIFEKENKVGGQASSEYSGNCFVEYSWRIFGDSYHNIHNLFNKLKISDHLTKMDKTCFIEKQNYSSADFSIITQYDKILNYVKLENYYKYFNMFLICKERAINEYQDVNAFEYYDENPIIQTIIGPFLGLDANKVSLSGALKNIYSITDRTKYEFTPNYSQIAKNPTQEAIFNDWEKYLINKNVKIYKNQSLEQINVEKNVINNIIVNGKRIIADEYIFACSLNPINKIISKNQQLNEITTFKNMKKLEKDLQLYFTINLYFSELLSESSSCEEIIIVDMPWLPIIQKKRNWEKKFMDKCVMNNKKIKDVWNIGFLDHNIGIKIQKRVGECSIDEAIYEGVEQVKNSEYIKNLLKSINKSFDDIYIGTEYWHQFINDKDNKLISKNPKFSINVGTMKNMPSAHPHDIPQNMYLAGYYVESSMGGVSMEASCETGLNAGQEIINKHKIKNINLSPIKHDNDSLTILTKPLIYIDEILHKYKFPPLTDYINSILLIFLLLFSYIVVMVLILKSFYFLLKRNYKTVKAAFMRIGN